MANTAPSKTVLIAALVLAGGAFFVLNTISQKLNPAEQEKLQKEEESQKAAEAAKTASPAPAAMPKLLPKTGRSDGKPSSLTALGESGILGKADGKREITVRWRWTPEVQANPQKLWSTLQQLEKDMPDAKIVVENKDEDPSAPTGIFAGSQTIAPALPDGNLVVNTDALKSATP